MATQRWASSISNLEARIRRSLGISGPIGLTLEDKPALVPVLLVDDLTRPGSSGTDYRGRRWALSLATGTIGAAARGNVFIVASALSTTVGNNEKGGVIVDTCEVFWAGSTSERITTEIRYAQQYATQPAVSIRDGFMVDPIGPPNNGVIASTVYAQSPCLSGTSATVAAGGFGERIARANIPNGTAVWGYWKHNLDVFLPEQAFLVVGNMVNLTNAAELIVNFRGRVF